MIKRGLLLVILFLFSLGLVQAILEVGLSKSSYSPGEYLEGHFNYSFSGKKVADTPVKILVNNVEVDISTLKDLEDLMSESMISVSDYKTAASYTEIPGTPISSKLFTFNSAESKVEIGVKFEDIPDKDSFSMSSIKLDISGGLNNKDYPMTPSLDFIDDGTNEWGYIGPLIDEYKDLKKNYLTLTEGNKEVSLDKGGKIYCEKVDLRPSPILPPSTIYDIKVKIKVKPHPDAIKLWAFIEGTSSGSAPNSYTCDNTKKECCIIEDPVQNLVFEDKGCKDNKINISEELSEWYNKDYFICIYQASATDSYYTINAENYAGTVEGWYDGESNKVGAGGLGNNFDYYMWGKYRVYETNLTASRSPVSIEADGEISNKISENINEYVNECETSDCIVPIKISSNGPGKIDLSNLELKFDYGGENIISTFIKLSSTPATISYDDVIKYDLGSALIVAPATPGNYKLKIIIGGESKEVDFSVISLPQAVIYYEPLIVTTGLPVYFTADESSSPSGANLIKFGWSFGDGYYANGSNATHVYKTTGIKKVELNVTDENGFFDGVWIDIEVLSLNETVRDNLNLSEELIKFIKTQVASSEEYVRDTAEILGLNALWDNALNQITLLKNEYNATREDKLLEIYNKLIALMDKVPQGIDVQSFSLQPNIVSITEIPSASDLMLSGAKEDFAQAVLAYQEGINIQGSVRVVDIIYLSGKEETFTLIKKTVSSSKTLSGKVYELIPDGNIKNITTPGYQIVSLNRIYNWPATTQMIVYTLNETDATYGINTRTIVVPQLSELTFEGGEELFEAGYECGNDECDWGEDEVSCPDDCKRHYPWTFIVSLILIALIGVYYFNFYKGPFNYKELGENLSNLFKGKPKLFKTKEDLNKIVNFAKVSKERGLSENQIKYMLKSKGWNEAQINEALRRTEPPKRKVIKIGQ